MSTSDSLPAVTRGAAPPANSDNSDAASIDLARQRPADSAETAPAQRTLPLHPAAELQQPLPLPATRPRQLWLGIHLPLLPLEALRRPRESAARAVFHAVFEEQEGIRRILLTNRAAERQGLASGMSVNAALALVPALELLPRDPGREMQALEALAARAGRFTSLVSIEPRDGLLLETAGSLTLFGGSEALLRQVETDLGDAGFTAAIAVAPTPLASTWLARSGHTTAGTTNVTKVVTHTEHLAGVLGSLPLACLRWPDAVCESLSGMGVTCLGDCLRLPREGFARRFGALRLVQLDRALGLLPDPRAGYRVPERFCREYELDEEEDDRELLLAVCRDLLVELERFLVGRQAAVQHLRFFFFHLKARATPLGVGGLEPGYSADHWHDLLAMKLDRLALPAPVIAIRLEGGHLQACRAETGSLPFLRDPERPQPPQAVPAARLPATRLIERLAARIGDDRVHGVTVTAEHRPHRAWRALHASGSGIAQYDLPQGGWHAPRLLGVREDDDGLLLERPLWLLAEPLPLDVEQSVPQYQGPLRIENGPERLETGWWDGEDIARDYFVAVNPKGMHLWIYCHRCNRRRDRDRDHGGWYLHGIFA